MPEGSDVDRVFIFDTTLRDAEQTPGCSLTPREKLEVAQQLARLNVDVIEAGFPVSSDEDFEAVRRIAQEVEGPSICGLSRAVNLDIDRAGEALKGAPNTRLHTFVGTSPQHIAMLRKAKGNDDVLKMAVDAVERARGHCEDVEFSAMDAARTERQFLYDIVEATIAAGARTINIPDTVGYAIPAEFAQLISDLLANVPNVGEAIISVHCHNDLGMAVTNTLSAIKNGARQAECTVNGLGERAGNAALEEIVMAVKTRGDYFGVETCIEARELIQTSRLVSRLMNVSVPPNKAIVGANAFAHSSGIHQDGVLKNRDTFEIMAPEDVGLEQTQIVLTARSGRHALKHRLEILGYSLSDKDLNKAYDRFIAVADKKKEVFDEDLAAIVSDELTDIPEKYGLDYLHTVSGTGTVPTATVRLTVDGEESQESAWGDGPVDASYKAVKKAASTQARVEQYAIRAITSGAEALGEVTVRLSDEGLVATGRAVSTDVIEASVKAYLDGLNRLAVQVGIEKQRAEAV